MPLRQITEITNEIFSIYQKTGSDAKDYLEKARKLNKRFGTGFAVIYCWFYSVPQKWNKVEPKIFELAAYTNYFDLQIVIQMPVKNIARILKPLVFYNQLSLQLKNFCKMILNEFGSWNSFSKVLNTESIFSIFNKLKNYKNTRISYKNLAAMKIFVGMDNNLIILDRHVAKIFGLSEEEQNKYRSRASDFLYLIKISESLTEKLREKGFDATMAEWALSLWFNGARLSTNKLLLENPSKG